MKTFTFVEAFTLIEEGCTGVIIIDENGQLAIYSLNGVSNGDDNAEDFRFVLVREDGMESEYIVFNKEDNKEVRAENNELILLDEDGNTISMALFRVIDL